MSANNAKSSGEVGSNLGANEDSPNFESPNIVDAINEELEALEEEDKKRRAQETVDIDGIPIEEKEQVFKTADITKRKKAEFFVNVEGDEERKLEAEKKRREAAKRETEAAKRSYQEKARLANEKLKKSKALQKKVARLKKKERRKRIFWTGWRRIPSAIIMLALIGGTGYLIYWGVYGYPKMVEEQRENEYAQEGHEISLSLYDTKELYYRGDIEAGNKAIDDIINSTEDSYHKAECYMFRSKVLSELGEAYEKDAISDALMAEQYDPTFSTADWICRLAEKNNDEELLKKYEPIRDARLTELSNSGGGEG